MRPIGQLETEEQARLFADYLFVHHIDAQIDTPSKPGVGWTIWVLDEDQVDESRGLLSRFRSMPDAEEFQTAAAAARIQRQQEKIEEQAEAKTIRRLDPFPWQMGRGGFNMVLLIGCVMAAFLTRLGQNEEVLQWLFLSLPLVEHGQVWRLLTPCFLHFGLFHLIFNMWWLQDLGGVLERQIGTWRYAALVLVVAVTSNLSQYFIGGSHFGGMSGVVYGLFGYLWARGRFDLKFQMGVSPMASGLLLIFLAMGIFGLMGPTANAAHFSGLVTGAAMGWLAAQRTFRRML
ncbi:MAG: rhomboid family intramembrane serine protease [Verrucomicrobiota bacterium]|jgi:GlpG protein|nr:rhomboid family intramembrane serine protease [Verrucomicrobiota bacterium]